MNTSTSFDRPVGVAPRRPTLRFMLAHPAHVLALGFGSGLSPKAPGTIGTLGAWLVFVLLQPYVDVVGWLLLIVFALGLGWWAGTITARHLGNADPSAVVWDEIVAFWIVLLLVTPASALAQFVAFVIFRVFDAVKPGPVAWADQLFKARHGRPVGWKQGFGILFDDLVAALCTLVVIALWRWL